MTSPRTFATALALFALPVAAPATGQEPGPAGTAVAPAKDSAVLLITGKKLADAWRPFAEWKTRTGRPTRIVTVAEIRERYEAKTVQEQIRLCVRDFIEHHGTRWVVLGGDCKPDGMGLVPGGHQTVHAQERKGIPTDIVYLSPTDWDADGDGICGEWPEDKDAITYPDGSVGLGRIPMRTPKDVAAFTKKVIEYESAYPEGGFAKQIVYTCTDKPAYPKVRRSWDGFLSQCWDGEMGRFFSEETPWDEKGKPGSFPLSAENIVDMINDVRIGKLHIHGHGHLPAWLLERRSKFTSKHVAQLANAGAYPLITTVSCNTGEYDSKQDPSIVESMLRRQAGGSVAIVAPVRTGKPHFHSRSDFRLMVSKGKLDGTTQTMTRYWVNGLGEGMSTGHALMKAKADMAEDARRTAGYHLCISEINLLGDPTLDMRADAPRTPKLEVRKSVDAGAQTVEVTTDAKGATICLWKGDEVYVVATADEAGAAACAVHPKTAGVIQCTVSGPSLNAVTRSIQVTAAKDDAGR